MDFSGIIGGILNFFGDLGSWLSTIWSWIVAIVEGMIQFYKVALQAIWQALKAAAQALGKVLSDLFNFRWAQFWQDLEAFFKAVGNFLKAIYNMIVGPLKAWMAMQQRIYQTILKPIIGVLSNIRQVIAVLGIFDRKLAAQLDAYLSGLENKVLGPLLKNIQRSNSIISYLRALITAEGYFDRPTLLESVRQNVAYLWKIVLNPSQLGFAPTIPQQPSAFPQFGIDWQAYIQTHTGDFSTQVTSDQALFTSIQESLYG